MLIPCILLSEYRAASQAVVGGMVMSKRVSNSCCCFGAAAQSKSLSVGHLEQKQAQTEAETTAFTAQQCSPWLQAGRLSTIHMRTFHYAITYFLLYPLFAGVRATLHWNTNIRAQVQSYEVYLEEQQ